MERATIQQLALAAVERSYFEAADICLQALAGDEKAMSTLDHIEREVIADETAAADPVELLHASCR